MATHRTTYKQWYAKLGDAVPVGLVPELLKIPQEQVIRAIHDGELTVHTFRSDNGRVYRMVRLRDIQIYGKNPLTLQGMTRAVASMMHSSRQQPTRHAA